MSRKRKAGVRSKPGNVFLGLLGTFIGMVGLLASARANQLHVVSAKGNRAVVEFDDGDAPKPGTVLSLAPVPSINPARSRDTTIGLATELSSMFDSKSGVTTTTITLNPRYGWNWGFVEAGPALLYNDVQKQPTSTRKITFGGFLDWNLVRNDGRPTVYGIAFLARVGQYFVQRADASYSNSATDIEVGPFVKLFIFKDASFCLRFDLNYAVYDTSSGDRATATTYSGTRLLGGLHYYF